MYKVLDESDYNIPSTYGALAQAVCINEHYYVRNLRTDKIISREHNYTGIHFWVTDRVRCIYSSSIRGKYSGCWYWDISFVEEVNV